MELTTAQMAELAHLEEAFSKAIDERYLRVTNAHDNVLCQIIYKQAAKSREFDNLNCSSCLLNLYIRLGRLYFATKSKVDADEAQKAQKNKPKKKAAEKSKGR